MGSPLGRRSAIATLSAQDAVYRFAQLHAAGANLGLACANDAEDARLGILHNLDFKLFARRIEVAAGFLYGAIQILALEFLKPFHTNPFVSREPAGAAYFAAAVENFFAIILCCAMDRMLLTSQYTTRPEGKFRNMAVKIKGRNIMIFCWVGSEAGGLIFC